MQWFFEISGLNVLEYVHQEKVCKALRMLLDYSRVSCLV